MTFMISKLKILIKNLSENPSSLAKSCKYNKIPYGRVMSCEFLLIHHVFIWFAHHAHKVPIRLPIKFFHINNSYMLIDATSTKRNQTMKKNCRNIDMIYSSSTSADSTRWTIDSSDELQPKPKKNLK